MASPSSAPCLLLYQAHLQQWRTVTQKSILRRPSQPAKPGQSCKHELQLTQKPVTQGQVLPSFCASVVIHVRFPGLQGRGLVPWHCPFVHFSLDRVHSRPQPLISIVMNELGVPIPEKGSDYVCANSNVLGLEPYLGSPHAHTLGPPLHRSPAKGDEQVPAGYLATCSPWQGMIVVPAS